MWVVIALLAVWGSLPEPSVTPLAVTPEMRQWVARQLSPPSADPQQRWRHLDRALAATLDLEEAPLRTATAAEAFAERRGNCVSYAHLVVALAREARLDAYFVLVEESIPTLERGDLRVVQKHLAAAFEGPDGASVIDLGGWRLGGPGDVPVPDRTAAAIFLSNRGVERLLADAPDEAGWWLRAAVGRDPGLAQVWVNLGVAERRAGRPRLAALAYRLALWIEPGMASARGNLKILERSLDASPPLANSRP